MTMTMKAKKEADRVLEEARRLGFTAEKTRNSHWKFTRPGAPAVYHSSTSGDRRAWKNGIAKLRRAAAGTLSPIW